MKKLTLWTLLTITFLSISCTNDFADLKTENESKQVDSLKPSSSKLDKSNVNIVDQNSLYPQIDSLLAQFYDESNFDTASILSINQAIHPNGNATVVLVAGNLDLTNSSIDQIRDVVSQTQGILALTVQNSSMTLAAKESLSNFIENVMQFDGDDYESILKSIELYQSIVSADDYYTLQDKDIILNISSIAYSSLFHERKRKDKDWDTAVANRDDFILTDEITFRTVRMALLVGIIQNSI